jgi:preprotein translocase subunit SecF
MEIFKQTNFDFLGKKWPFIILSLVLTAAGLASLALKGGPKYGIDFNGGALMDVNFIKRPTAEAIRSALRQKISGEIEVQEISNTQEVLISTGARDDKALQIVRGDMISTLNGAFNPAEGNKLDLNTAGQAALADRLRAGLVKAGVGFSDDQLTSLTKAITTFRDTPPRSGLVRDLDNLSQVSGVTPQILSAIKQECFAGTFAIRGVDIVGPKSGSD